MWHVIHRRSKHLHEPNGVRVLRLVRDHGTISRIEIAKATGLHKATVTELVVRLIDAGFLEDTGELGARRKVGRKRRMLRFLPLAGVVAGVDIRMTRVTVAITDLNADVIIHDSFEYDQADSSDEVLSRVAAMIKNLLKASRNPVSKLLGIGIGVQGIIDCSTNTLVLSYSKQSWRGESLSGCLEQEFNVPVYVENDVKTRTLGEYLLGSAKKVKDFVHVWVGEGVGAGIMIKGQLLHGVTSSAGEIGSTLLNSCSVDSERFPLTFRGQEIFGEILSDANLIQSYRLHAANGDGQSITVPYIAERARLGDPIAQQVINEFVALLSILSVTLVNTLNPEMIVIGGKLAHAFPAAAELLQNRIHEDVLTPPAEAVRVRCATHNDKGVLLGAAGLILYDLFEPFPRVPFSPGHRHTSAVPLATPRTA